MKEMEVKKSILKEIMDMMDARESEGLKKHPSLASKLEAEKPESEEMTEEMPEEKPEMDMMAEEKPESDDEISEEDLERLMELHRSLKG